MVFLHEQPEVVVLAFEAGVFVGDDGVVGELVEGVTQQAVGIAAGHVDAGALAVHEPDEFAHGRFLFANGEDGLLGEAFLDHDGLDHAVHNGGLDDLAQPLFIDGEPVLRFALFDEALADLLGAAVALQALFEVALRLVESRGRLVFEALDEVPAVLGFDGVGNGAVSGQCKGRFLKRLHHAAGSELRQFAAFGAGALVVAVLAGQFGEVGARRQFGGEGVDFGLGLFGTALVVVGADHDVGHAYLAAGSAAAGDLDDVVSEAGADRPDEVSHAGLVASVFEGVNHHEGAEPAEVATVVLDARVVTASPRPGDGGEVFPGSDALFQRAGFVPRGEGVHGCGFRAEADEQVRGAHLFQGAVVRFLHQGVEQLVVDEVGAGELGAVSRQLGHEGSGGVHAEVFGSLHLEFEVNEELHVRIEGFGRHDAVAVVLLEDVGEVVGAHSFSGDGDHGLGVGEGQEGGESKEAQGMAEHGGEGHVTHRGEWMAECSACLGI